MDSGSGKTRQNTDLPQLLMAFRGRPINKQPILHKCSHTTPSHEYPRLAIGRIKRQDVIDCGMGLGEGKGPSKVFRSPHCLITVTPKVHS